MYRRKTPIFDEIWNQFPYRHNTPHPSSQANPLAPHLLVCPIPPDLCLILVHSHHLNNRVECSSKLRPANRLERFTTVPLPVSLSPLIPE